MYDREAALKLAALQANALNPYDAPVQKMDTDNGTIRKFETGATRDTATDKYEYDGFFSPAVLERRAEYMHKHRKQADGSLRDPDNWQKGIPQKVYMSSMFRHFVDVWKWNRYVGLPIDIEEALCALMFNSEGMLHEILKKKQEKK
jgi:hypothetical protein